ncbi:Putative membrane protein [Thermobacillus xylanilyticus]|jgi:membrane protein DedA with SNARE-associated domain|uniref:Membrane protein n=1 Tax=Thermobacillus xylanilyticus TaxID=76633 RepID=A0ABM8V2X0_THEXY|nr:DedA family protein [Thermobacillus xylanilyticus]REJ12969.1 MAG: alkaline phosphatase [Paenibacillaceae bacterium]CAG5084055.1 Putative membrane protein [Thermobacillus xylanilyticus]
MEHWITEFMESYGYFGILLLIAIENLFPPIPSEIILTFGGFMTTTSSMTIFGVVLAATLGSMAGAILLYGVGRVLSAERLEAIVVRYGKILRLKPEDIRKADAWFDRYGPWAVFFGRLVPLVRSLISIPAGSSGMNFTTFLVLTTAGSLIWNTALVSIGAAVGASWESIVHYMDVYSYIVYALIALGGIAFIVWFVRNRVLKERK